MTANISIPIALADNVVAVPLSAVYTENGERFVYIKKGEFWEQRNVQIGVADFSFVEITSGISEGEIVSLEPPPAEQIHSNSPSNAANTTNNAMKPTNQNRQQGPGGGNPPPPPPR